MSRNISRIALKEENGEGTNADQLTSAPFGSAHHTEDEYDTDNTNIQSNNAPIEEEEGEIETPNTQRQYQQQNHHQQHQQQHQQQQRRNQDEGFHQQEEHRDSRSKYPTNIGNEDNRPTSPTGGDMSPMRQRSVTLIGKLFWYSMRLRLGLQLRLRLRL